ncbi:unnamed protein product [Cuscuta europaea]|uniref:Thioredoxin-like protein HCF164, chloroplastic n=1 Tax=Cuscuta europaea TaxID=41803 RepID=A0A9P0Z1T7_CUSEU|nr:unnamed protein product [Cuscuta europaea]
MAHVAVCPVSFHKFRPFHFNLRPSLHIQHPYFQYLKSCRRFHHQILCETNPNRNPAECCQTADSVEKVQVDPGSSNGVASSEVSVSSNDRGRFLDYADTNFNRRIALVSAVGAVVLFLSQRLDFGVSLKDLSAAALPLEKALSNGKPTVVEFYADWCEVCKESAADVYKVEQQYRDRVNFVMLNVDNTKWEQELDEFGVEGIPHFAFLDKDGNEQGNVVGRLPGQYLLENVEALSQGGQTSVPHTHMVGQYSNTAAGSRELHRVVGPRSHG